MLKFVLVFFVLVNGEPKVLAGFEHPSKESCEQAKEWADFGEPYGTLKAEHPDLQMECWPLDESPGDTT